MKLCSGGASKKKEIDKDTKYLTRCEQNGDTFTPIAIETFGGFGDAFAELFREWLGEQRAAEIAAGGSGWATTATSIYWQQKINVAVHNAVFEMVATRLVACS